MSKNSLPIEEQVSQLTKEQRDNIPKIRKQLISVIAIFAIACILLGAVASLAYTLKANNALTQFKATMKELLETDDNLKRFELLVKQNEYLEVYEQSLKVGHYPLVFAAVGILIGATIIIMVFNKKYPYFSEQRYSYIRKEDTQEEKTEE